MRSSVFQDAAVSATRVLGRKDVNVVFRGGDAATDGNTVYLPALPPGADIDEVSADVIRGYRDHESMHVRCTDMRHNATLAQRRDIDEFYGDITNIVEDIRIERAGIQAYPGMLQTLSATQRAAGEILKREVGNNEAAIKDAPAKNQLLIALQAMGRIRSGMDVGYYEEFLKHIDPKVYDFAKRVTDSIMSLETGAETGRIVKTAAYRGTAQGIATSERIFSEFKAEFNYVENQKQTPPTPPEPSENGKGSGGIQINPGRTKGNGEGGSTQQGGDPDGKGSGSDQSGSGGGDGSDSQGAGSGGSPNNGQDQSGSPDDAGGVGTSSQNAGPNGGENGGSASDQPGGGHRQGLPDIGDAPAVDLQALKDAASKALKETVRKIYEHAGSPDGSPPWIVYDRDLVSSGPAAAFLRARDNSSYSHWAGVYDEVKSRITNQAAMIRRTLETELQARWDRQWQGGKTSGRLHQVRVVDALHGSPNVYQSRSGGKEMDTLLVLSIDGSGSMNEDMRMINAQRLTIALCDALERTGVDIEVEVWSTRMEPCQNQAWPSSPSRNHISERMNQRAADLKGRANSLLVNRIGVTTDDPSYPSKDPNGNHWQKAIEDSRLYASLGYFRRIVVKDRKQRLASEAVKTGIGAMANMVGGGTPMIDAVDHAISRLSTEQHSKKILMVLTDGDPDQPTEFTDHSVAKAHMKSIHRFASRAGIHLMGVGIGVEVSRWFDHSVCVDSNDLYAEAIKMVAKYIGSEVRPKVGRAA